MLVVIFYFFKNKYNFILMLYCYLCIKGRKLKQNKHTVETQYKCFLRPLRRQKQIKKVDPVFRTFLKHICRVRSLEKSCLHLDHPQARFYPQIFCLSLLWWIPDKNE